MDQQTKKEQKSQVKLNLIMSKNNNKEILILYGGMGSEKDISLLTTQALVKVIKKLKKPYQMIEANKNLPHQLSQIKDIQKKVAFICLHGKYGEDGSVQGLLEYLKLPYTGSGVLSSAICMDKVMTREILEHHDIPIPPGHSINFQQKKKSQALPVPKLKFPLIVKPAREGSSFGVSLVKEKAQWKAALQKAAKYDCLVLIEKYIEGIEYSLPFLSPNILPSVQIVPKKGFYNYENKYTSGKTKYHIPAKVSKDLEKKAIKIALKICQICRIRGYARIDFRLDLKKQIPYVIEVNTLPGLTPLSLLPQSAAAAGISFSDLIKKILNGAGLDYQ